MKCFQLRNRVLALAAFGLLPSFVSAQPDTVPNLVGLAYEEAKPMVSELHVSMIGEQALDSTRTPGVVFEQIPGAGTPLAGVENIKLRYAVAARNVTVPKLVGLTLEEAKGLLSDVNVQLTVKEQRAGERQAGMVLQQSIEPHSETPEGAELKLTVATAAETVEIPDVLRKSLVEANVLLRHAGVHAVVFTEKTTAYPAGFVFEQRPAAGKAVALGTPVYLNIAVRSGRIELPDLRRKTLVEASALLDSLQLQFIVVEEEAPSLAPGTVIRQSRGPGSRVDKGDYINLVAATAPATTDVPDLLGLPVELACLRLRDQGLQFVVRSDQNAALAPGTVLRQSPAGESTIPTGSQVIVVVATTADSVTMPDVTGQNVAQASRTFRDANIPLVLIPEEQTHIEPGRVVAQLAPPGVRLPAGSPVYLKVATRKDGNTLPDFTKMTYPEAKAALREMGINMAALPVKNITLPPQTVLTQSPAAGTPVYETGAVYLTFAVTGEMVETPDLVGRSTETATASLQEKGFLVTISQIDTIGVEPGTVVRQSLPAGSPHDFGSQVELVVAGNAAAAESTVEAELLGAGQDSVEAPDVIGQSLQQALQGLAQLNIKIDSTIQMTTLKNTPGTVLRQIPPAGTKMAPGSSVVLEIETLSFKMPVAEGLAAGQVQSQLREQGYVANVTVEEKFSFGDANIVLAQEPAAGSAITVDTPIRLLVTSNRIFGINVWLLAIVAAIVLIAGFVILNVATSPGSGKDVVAADVPTIAIQFNPNFGAARVRIKRGGSSEKGRRTGKKTKDGLAKQGFRAQRLTVLSEETAASDVGKDGRRAADTSGSRGGKQTVDGKKLKKIKIKIAFKKIRNTDRQTILCRESLIANEISSAGSKRENRDPLTQIEGIGPKVSGLLQSRGIHTFAKLAQSKKSALRKILDTCKLYMIDPETWPEQSGLAAAERWQALAQLQHTLKAGRRVGTPQK